MLYLNDMVLGYLYLLFPICCYYFYVAYNKIVEGKENRLFKVFALLCSMYILNLQTTCNYPRMALLLSYIPIIIMFIDEDLLCTFILSGFYIICTYTSFDISIGVMIIEFALYYLLYHIKRKTKMNDILFIILFFVIKIAFYFNKCLFDDDFFFTTVINGDNLLITIPLVIITTFIVYFLYKVGSDITRYHMTFKELAHEKQIRDSLFKITHEIKNPLAVFKGYLDMLDINNKDQIEKYIPIIKNELNHTLFILKDFSDFSKLKIKKDDIDINYLISDVIYSMSGIFNRDNIKVIFEPQQEIYIYADYSRLMQVFINFLKNSIEAFDPKKKNKRIKIEVLENKNSIDIIYTDNGIGMSKETLSHMKEPFYTTKTNGTGLGVLLSNEIIELHGGNLSFDSKEGKGVKISIMLPKK